MANDNISLICRALSLIEQEIEDAHVVNDATSNLDNVQRILNMLLNRQKIQSNNRIAIYVNGGVVQDIISDTPGLSAMLIDYDNEKAGSDPKNRSFEPIRVDINLIEETINGAEQ